MSNTDDQGRDDGFRDPTAPSMDSAGTEGSEPTPDQQPPWTSPTAPADPSSYPPPGQDQTGVPGQGYPAGQPYGQQPPSQSQYGQDQYGQQPYGSGYPPYGQGAASTYGMQGSAGAGYPAPYQPPPYGGAPGYGPRRQNSSALALTIVSGATLLFCGGLLVIPALIFGIIALTKQNHDPAGSSRMSRWGWWAYAAGVVVTIIVAITIFAIIIAASESSSYSGY
jgi:hypothetical protein